MNLYEYQAKRLLHRFAIPVPYGEVLTERTQVADVFEKIGGSAVVKAQVHAGGRGKAGGVKIVRSLEDAQRFVDSMLGKQLVTAQTTAEGERVEALYFEQMLDITHELYLSYVFNREKSCVTCIVSTAGGMDIEKVAEETPEAIARFDVNPLLSVQDYQLRAIRYALELDKQFSPAVVSGILAIVRNLYPIYLEHDLNLLEINPLVVTKQEVVMAADAKVSIDDNATYRHGYLFRQIGYVPPEPTPAEKLGLSYIQLDGNIGCLVNGAGLAMATMDSISLAGGTPANFLDIGGNADAAKICEAIRIMIADPRTQGIFINVFGGINQCDVIADGVIRAIRASETAIPFVVRLQGKNYEEGLRMIRESGYNIRTADDMESGSAMIVDMIRQ